VTGERITKTYSWTVSSGAEKVDIVMLMVVRVRCLGVIHSAGTCQPGKHVYNYGQFYAATVMLDLYPWW
jgi:hypothetical protein